MVHFLHNSMYVYSCNWVIEYRKFIGNKNKEFESVKSMILNIKLNLFYCENYSLH